MLSKSKVLVVVLCLTMIFVMLSTTVLAGRPTEKIKYSDRSDCVVYAIDTVGYGTVYEDSQYLSFGDNQQDYKYRALYKFQLGGIKVSSIDWVELEFHILGCYSDNIHYGDPTFPNIGLGDTLVIPIEDYGRTASAADYNSDNIGAPVVLIPAGYNPTTNAVSANVTDAVIAAKTARSRFVTFRVQTADETDSNKDNDHWQFSTRENPLRDYRPRLIVHLKQ